MYIVLRNLTTPHPKIVRHKEEKYYTDPASGKVLEFPSYTSNPELFFSIIVPAYNEEDRICVMLDECLEFMEDRLKSDKTKTYEVIVVSDGSRDKTVEVAMKYSKLFGSEKVRVLELIKNRGKGGAVRLGMMSARGRYLLFADADGATKFSDFGKISKKMIEMCPDWNQEGIVIGSRAHLQKDAVAERSVFRTILMFGFHMLVYLFAVRKIQDTQCGFKLLSRKSAQTLFQLMHVERWAFDVELLYLAESLRIPVAELAVNWTEIDGSKITPFWSWLEMGGDLINIWFHYTSRIWKRYPNKASHSD